jgi:arylsulfatase A-like enzyme
MVQWLNGEHRAARAEGVDDLSSRITSYELAFRMQSAVPEAVDLGQETEATRRLYGLDDPISARFGADCLIARRLVERGVRFVQVFTGSGGSDDWDAAHAENDKTHREMARRTDRPIAGLLKDLKARGLLGETLVIWGGEFGRTPVADGRYPDKPAGRDHNPYGFTTWLAGGGVQGGRVIGATDEFGLRAVEDPIHVNDLHATVLHLLGLDHRELTYLSQGREQRLTDVGGDGEFADRLLG